MLADLFMVSSRGTKWSVRNSKSWHIPDQNQTRTYLYENLGTLNGSKQLIQGSPSLRKLTDPKLIWRCYLQLFFLKKLNCSL